MQRTLLFQRCHKAPSGREVPRWAECLRRLLSQAEVSTGQGQACSFSVGGWRKDSPGGLLRKHCLGLGHSAHSSLEETWAEGPVVGGKGVSGCSCPTTQKRRWLKLVLTSGRPGSRHGGISMETQVCRPCGAGDVGVASAWCPWGASGDPPSGEANHRAAHRAKRASSDRSGFFRPEGFEAGAGASMGGEGRSGTISAALALSSRNLSNSAIQTKARVKVGEGRPPEEAHPSTPQPVSSSRAGMKPTQEQVGGEAFVSYSVGGGSRVCPALRPGRERLWKTQSRALTQPLTIFQISTGFCPFCPVCPFPVLSIFQISTGGGAG